ncbi:MAG: TlpA disulfide reductase family protein [Candidatus Brocadiia bacterium]
MNADSKGNFLIGRVALALFLLLVIGMAAAIGVRLYRGAGGLPAPPVEEGGAPTGRQMAYDWPVRDLQGEPFDLESTRGKAVFLNFWATWCPPCAREMPAIQRLYDQLKAEPDVAFLVVAYDRPDAVRAFVEDMELTMPIYTTTGPIPQGLVPEAVPTTYVVSPEGEVVFEHVGAAAWDAPQVAEFIRKVAASAPEGGEGDG